ncbi:LysR family transcriptional regulator [Gordonia sp. X0973]|uniref:LysR family transcriptional regulator n=1 Tax=Gordonia sp. X0973 TaxID=2742602 RepID=UPI000F51D74C|nr:LysR family transcriptional regulator [Gordonia sp. X0973]QKT08476.1 LysR family transcriptional regulator [Gordonia sp. X0973]
MATFNRLHLIRQVDLFTLQLFLSAIEEKQIGLAAIRENIAASTATKRIQVLEDIAGVELLERTPHGVVPTRAGEVLERYLRQVFANIDEMRAEVAALTEGVQGELTISSARSIIVPFLARELAAFGREYPLVDSAVTETENTDIIARVSRGDSDVGVFAAATDLDLSGVDVLPYREDRLVAVVPLGHVLAGTATVTFEELVAYPLVAPRALTAALQVAATRLGRDFESPHNVRSAEVATSLVEAGIGVSIVPESTLDHEMSSRVAVLELQERWAVRRIHLATPAGRALSPAARAFVEYLLIRPADESDEADGQNSPSQ